MTRLQKFDSDARVDHILRLMSVDIRQDEELFGIFKNFKWNQHNKLFEDEVKKEDLIKKLEEVYDFKLEEINEDEKNKKTARKESFGNLNSYMYNSVGSNLSFSQNRNGT